MTVLSIDNLAYTMPLIAHEPIIGGDKLVLATANNSISISIAKAAYPWIADGDHIYGTISLLKVSVEEDAPVPQSAPGLILPRAN